MSQHIHTVRVNARTIKASDRWASKGELDTAHQTKVCRSESNSLCVSSEECWDVVAVVDVGQSDSPAHE